MSLGPLNITVNINRGPLWQSGDSNRIPLNAPCCNDEAGAPPSYEEAIDPNAPPPSYDSLFGKVREAQKTSKGILDFLKNVVIIILGTVGCTIILGVTIVIPISMIIIGSLYLHDCPQGEYIPVYLLVGGIFGILKQLLHLSTRVRQTERDRQEETLRQSPTQTLLNCFMLGWFIIGSVWVYKEYQPDYDPASAHYCNKNLYLFAFWLITSVYILLVSVPQTRSVSYRRIGLIGFKPGIKVVPNINVSPRERFESDSPRVRVKGGIRVDSDLPGITIESEPPRRRRPGASPPIPFFEHVKDASDDIVDLLLDGVVSGDVKEKIKIVKDVPINLEAAKFKFIRDLLG